MADFLTAHRETQGYEGGISNNKYDRGGYTYKGISRKNWPNWEGWHFLDTRARLTPNEQEIVDGMVERFYRANFWDRISLTSFTNQRIANELYDTGVNMHPKTAIMLLQKALNLLNRNGQLYEDIVVDGLIGMKTLTLTNNHPYPDSLLKLLNGLQLSRYVEICEKDPTQEEFLRGWLKRIL